MQEVYTGENICIGRDSGIYGENVCIGNRQDCPADDKIRIYWRESMYAIGEKRCMAGESECMGW
jgi:hypothetical protein